MEIAIVGCGVAGQAAAIALARQGHSVIVFERFEQAQPLGAGLLLQPSGLTALAWLGLESAALNAGARISRLLGHNRRGKPVMNVAYTRGARSGFGIGIHRAALFDILHSALSAEQIEVRLNADIERIEVFERPLLVERSGRRNGPFDLVIVASGAHDVLREQVSPRHTAPLYPWGALWTTCKDPAGVFPDTLRQVYDGAHTMIGVLPVGAGPDSTNGDPLVSFFWSLRHADYEAARQRGLTDLRARVAGLWPEAAELLEQVTNFESLALATYRDVKPKQLFRGRVLLIGDAAHGTSPQLGQGANLALIDAVTLANCVDDTKAIEPSLEQYSKMRRSQTKFYQLISRRLTPVFQSDSRMIAVLRDLIFPVLCSAPVTSEWAHRVLTGYAQLSIRRWKPPY